MERRRGFTLIELLVVIAIIAILAVLVVTQLSGAQQKARNSNAKSDITEMGKSVELYKNDDNNSGSLVVAVTSSATGPATTDAGMPSGWTTPAEGATYFPTTLYGTSSSGTGIETLFTGSQAFDETTAGAGRYGTGVTKTPSNSHVYTYASNTNDLTASQYSIWTTVTSNGFVNDTSFCVKNGTSLNATDSDNPGTPPNECTAL